jgi:hypothetical protein
VIACLFVRPGPEAAAPEVLLSQLPRITRRCRWNINRVPHRILGHYRIILDAFCVQFGCLQRPECVDKPTLTVHE